MTLESGANATLENEAVQPGVVQAPVPAGHLDRIQDHVGAHVGLVPQPTIIRE